MKPKLQNEYPNALDYAGYIGLHVACFAAIWTGATWGDLVLCLVCYVTRMFGLMAGFHRYFAHRSFKTSRVVQFLLALLGTLGVQKGVLWWASTHRHHHRYSDTELDLHSPVHKTFLYSHSGWFLDNANRTTDMSLVADLARYPELVWLNHWDLVPVSVFAVLLWICFGWGGLVWGFCISTVLIWHAIHAIGSFGHRFGGYRRFATADNSRNKWFLAVVLLGEGWHNNHHFYPSSARAGFVWWEYDLAYWILRLMARVGLVWDLHMPPKNILEPDNPRAQVQSRSFDRWLTDLRIRFAKQLEIASAEAPREAQIEYQMLRQMIEQRLDAFGAKAIEALLSDPELLQDAIADLRQKLTDDLSRVADTPAFQIANLAQSLDAELRAHVPDSTLAHFMTVREDVAERMQMYAL